MLFPIVLERCGHLSFVAPFLSHGCREMASLCATHLRKLSDKWRLALWCREEDGAWQALW